MREKEQALLLHLQRFGKAGRAFAAPARVNLIGEHTDYTGGLVMPMAIGFHTVAVLSPRADNRAVFYSASFDEEVSFEIASMGLIPDGRGSDYPAGVLWSLRQEGFKVDGFNMSLVGDVPLGAGLSSSASLEVASAMALLGHTKEVLPLKRLATLCRRAENEYVGAKSGIMDQFVVGGAIANRAMLLDCRSLEFELLPLPVDVRVVICNSMVKHAVATESMVIGAMRLRRGRQMMGASNPHPHGQIWASRSVPNEVVTECGGQQAYWAEKNEVLLCAYLAMEEELGERLVEGNASFVAVVPYWAVWPFEVMILPRRHMTEFQEMTDTERLDFAAILQAVAATYDQVFDTPFPYSMGLHPAPCDGNQHPEWQFHAHFYPPLLRSATIRKFMVGFELLGGPQRDITPESAAETLRQASARVSASRSTLP